MQSWHKPGVPEWLSPKILARIPGAFRKVIIRRGAANVWVSPHFGFIKDDFIPEGDCQSAFRFCIPSWPCILGDRGAEARKRAEWAWCSWSTGDYKCDAGMSIENVHAAVNIKPPKGRFIAHTFSNVLLDWKTKEGRLRGDKYWVLRAVVKA